ncbi:MAG: LPS assembly lipoprotein LptE [Candidatus Aminicenantia bacterium]
MFENMRILNLFLILPIIFFAGCGYALVGTGKSLSPNLKVIAVPVFKNKSQRVEIEKIITSVIAQEMVRRGVKITEDERSSDAVLRGEIIAYSTYPTSFSPSDSRATKYGISVVLRVALFSSKGEEIYPYSELRFNDEYDLREGVDFYSIETERLEKLSEQIAKSVVSLILEGF